MPFNLVANECDGNARYLLKLFLNSVNIAPRNGEDGIELKIVKEIIKKER